MSRVDLTFEAPLTPRGQGRPRTAVIAGRARVYQAPDDRRWKESLAAVAQPHRPLYVLDGPLAVDVLAVMPRPQHRSRKSDPPGLIWAPVRPDADNVRKAVLDALSTWWRDDACVVAGATIKVYAEKTGHSRLVVRVRSIDGGPEQWIAAAMASAESFEERPDEEQLIPQGRLL